jgi:subtilisin family serine protease
MLVSTVAAGVVAAVTLGIAGTAVAAPTGEILGELSPSAIAGQYTVVLTGDVAGAPGSTKARATMPDRARALASRYGGTLGAVWDAVLTGFSITMSPAQAKRLAADPAVKYVQQDVVGTVTGTQFSPPWGLDRIDQRFLPLSQTYTYPNTASGIYVFVIDSGIRHTHTEFGGRVSGRVNFVPGQGLDDCFGHGTGVAGVVAGANSGVAKQARLISVKVADCSGGVNPAWLISALNYVRTSSPSLTKVANISLAGPLHQGVDDAVRSLVAAGVDVVVGAGNDGQSACNRSPARVAEAITVAASDSADARWSSSNYGTCVDVFAPGVGIFRPMSTCDACYTFSNGTSFAAPHVAGAVALMLTQNLSLTPTQVQTLIKNNATMFRLTNIGAGSPNRLLYVTQ